MVGQDSIDLRRMALFALYFQYIVNPRLLSLSGLTLLLTGSDVDPAGEASLIVLGSCFWSGHPHRTETVQS